ncbi:N-acetylmuramidase domain-containing protein [Rahnella inusitata]|uniref:N-acetylmuramidase domain-containing protein n=1 Tax=Rahnella inusitata TaxID=58169 RepID=UPI0039BEA316
MITDQKIPVQAGASLGHLGFFQIPTETGFRSRSRYMVHIECLTSDSKVVSFLTNPEAAGHENPAFLKYPADAALFSQDAQGAMAKSTRKTKATGILTLSKVPTVSADGTPTHYQIRPEGGFLAAASVEKLSQFDLGKLGFSIIKDDPESFQLLDAENQPQNVVKGIFEKLKAAAENDPVFSNALANHKYKQLLDVIDQNHDGYYSVDEYRNAVHNPTYRDPLYQLIVQHPSEWYYEKTDPKWTKYLEKLEPDASKWKKYTEAFLDNMIWMKKVAGMGPAPWHMHPVMFMGNFKPINNQCYCYKQGIVSAPCQSGVVDVSKNDFELLANQLGIEREVLRAIAVAETGDKVPFQKYVANEKHATILYERHYMKRLSKKLGVSQDEIDNVEKNEPKIIHSWERGYSYGSNQEQFERLLRAREINYDAANMSCSWVKFQVMGEYYSHLYTSTQELVDAQNYCALQHLQYFKVFLVKEKRMLQPMKDKDWLTIAKKYNGERQDGYDKKN